MSRKLGFSWCSWEVGRIWHLLPTCIAELFGCYQKTVLHSVCTHELVDTFLAWARWGNEDFAKNVIGPHHDRALVVRRAGYNCLLQEDPRYRRWPFPDRHAPLSWFRRPSAVVLRLWIQQADKDVGRICVWKMQTYTSNEVHTSLPTLETPHPKPYTLNPRP